MELVMDRRVVWNSMKLKEIDEAKSVVMKFKRLGYEIVLSNGKPMEKFKPSFEEVIIKAKRVYRNILKILTEDGDDRLTWDRENGQQAKEAKAKFFEFLKKGYKAFSVDVKGEKNRRIDEFDVDAEEILMIPPTSQG